MNELLYEKITDALVSDGYIVINDVLDAKSVTALYNTSKDETLYSNAGISSSSDVHVDKKRRSDKTLWLDSDSPALKTYFTFTDALKEYLNRSLYLGLTYYEAHFSIYDKGSFYEKHIDAFKGSKNRVVTTVFYLNEEWSERDGGALVIYDEKDTPLEKVLPKFGTLVVFLSDRFPHEVEVAMKQRHSIAGWFRVDKRA